MSGASCGDKAFTSPTDMKKPEVGMRCSCRSGKGNIPENSVHTVSPPPRDTRGLGRTRANGGGKVRNARWSWENGLGCGPEELVKMYEKQWLGAKNFLVIHSASSSLYKKAHPVG